MSNMDFGIDLMDEVERKASKIKISPEQLAKIIDSTLLHPNKSGLDFEKLCMNAQKYGFYAVCVNPYWVRFCANQLQGTGVKVVSVVGFPLGQSTTKIKALEAREAVENGASEADMVMNLAALKDKKYDLVKEDVEAVVGATNGKPVKVILETGYLSDEEIVKACEIAMEAGAAFVKTSTGFGPLGATVPHVYLMRKTVGDKMGVKASGGIKSFGDALRMIAAGANRIGASEAVKMIEGCK